LSVLLAKPTKWLFMEMVWEEHPRDIQLGDVNKYTQMIQEFPV